VGNARKRLLGKIDVTRQGRPVENAKKKKEYGEAVSEDTYRIVGHDLHSGTNDFRPKTQTQAFWSMLKGKTAVGGGRGSTQESVRILLEFIAG